MPAEESQVIASHADQQHDVTHAHASRQSQPDNRELCGLPCLHQGPGSSSVQESDRTSAAASDIFQPARDDARTLSATEWAVVASGFEAGGAGQAQVTSPTGHDVLAVTGPDVVLQSESPSAALTAAPVMAQSTAVPVDQATVPGCPGRSKCAAAGQDGAKATLKAVARRSKTSSKVGNQLGSRKVGLHGSRDTSRLQHVMATASVKHGEVPKELGVMHSDSPGRREARAAASSSNTDVLPLQMHVASPRSDAVPTSMRHGRSLHAAAVSPRAASVSPKAAVMPSSPAFTFPRPAAVSPTAAAAASPKAAVPKPAAASPRSSLTARATSTRPHSASPKAAATSRPAFVSAIRSGSIVLPSHPMPCRPHSGGMLASTPSATEAVRMRLADHLPSNQHRAVAAQVDCQALIPQVETHVPLMHISHDAFSAGQNGMAEPQQDRQSHSSAYHCPQTYADCSLKASGISQADADHLQANVDHRHMATDPRHMAVDHRHGATDHCHMAVHPCHMGTDHRRSDESGQLGEANQQDLGHPLLLAASRPGQASAPDDIARDSQSDCESSSCSADPDFDCGQSLSSQRESASGDRRRQVSSARNDFAQQPDSVGSIAQLFMMRQRAKAVFQVSVQHPKFLFVH